MSIRLLIALGCTAWGACVTGRVVDATGAPVGGGSAELITRTSMEAVQRLGHDGLFRFCNAPANEYKVLIRVQGFRIRQTAAFAFDSGNDIALGDVAISIGEITEGPVGVPVPKIKYPVVWSFGGDVMLAPRKSRTRRLTPGYAPVLSPDKRRVVFVRMDDESAQLWVIDTDGKSEPVPVSQSVRAMWNLRFEDNDRVVCETTTWETGDVSVTLPLGRDKGKRAACVSGHLTDTAGASIDDAKIALESRTETIAATKGGSFRLCTDAPGQYRIVATGVGFRPRSTAAFALRQDIEMGAVEMRINTDEIVCNLPILTNPDEPYPYLDTSGNFVAFTGRDGVRRKFPRQPSDRQYNLDNEWKRVVFVRDNEIWVDERRVYTHTAFLWEPEFAPDGKSIRFWSTTWKEGDRQFTVPIHGR